MRLLLSCIQKALDQENGTDANVFSEDDGEHITMHLKTSLPAALQPLQWNIVLQKLPPSAITEKIIVPLLKQQMIARTEQSSLLQHLKEKDSIISKLMSQMQADGSDMSKIFPGGASPRFGNKTKIRLALSKSVKGMAEFDEHAWRCRVSQEIHVPRNMQELLSKLSPVVSADSLESFMLKDEVSWWQSTKRRKEGQKKLSTSGEVIFNHMDEQELSSRDTSGFQVRGLDYNGY